MRWSFALYIYIMFMCSLLQVAIATKVNILRFDPLPTNFYNVMLRSKKTHCDGTNLWLLLLYTNIVIIFAGNCTSSSYFWGNVFGLLKGLYHHRRHRSVLMEPKIVWSLTLVCTTGNCQQAGRSEWQRCDNYYCWRRLSGYSGEGWCGRQDEPHLNMRWCKFGVA